MLSVLKATKDAGVESSLVFTCHGTVRWVPVMFSTPKQLEKGGGALGHVFKRPELTDSVLIHVFALINKEFLTVRQSYRTV
jgi:hypothetical protein